MKEFFHTVSSPYPVHVRTGPGTMLVLPIAQPGGFSKQHTSSRITGESRRRLPAGPGEKEKSETPRQGTLSEFQTTNQLQIKTFMTEHFGGRQCQRPLDGREQAMPVPYKAHNILFCQTNPDTTPAFALLQGGSVRHPIPSPAAGTAIIEKEKFQMVQRSISKSHTEHIHSRDHTHTNDRYGTFETGVGSAIGRADTRTSRASTFTVGPTPFEGANLVFASIPRSMVLSLSRTTAHAPVLSPAKSEFFQTVTKRIETTLSILQDRQNSELTTLHITGRTSGPGGTAGKTGPKPPTPPQLDYFTPVGTIQPKTAASLTEREETTVTTPGTGLMSRTVTDNSTPGRIPPIPGINSAAVSHLQEGSIDFDRLTDRVYRTLESKIRMERNRRGW
jgi:hypothetical protein